MSKFVLLGLLMLASLPGCGGGTGVASSSGSNTSNNSSNQAAAPLQDVVRQWNDGDQLTYSLTPASKNSSAASGELVATTHLDYKIDPSTGNVVDASTGKADPSVKLQYGNRALHVSWDVRIPANASTPLYTQDNYYQQSGSGAIYYLGYKTSTVDRVQAQCAFKPLLYCSPLSSYGGAQTSFIAIYPDGSHNTELVSVAYADQQVIGDQTACKVSTTVDSNPTATTWFSSNLGYPVQFGLSFNANGTIYDMTATLTSTNF